MSFLAVFVFSSHNNNISAKYTLGNKSIWASYLGNWSPFLYPRVSFLMSARKFLSRKDQS